MGIRRATHSDAASLAVLSIEVWANTYLRNGIGKVFAEYALATFTTANFERLIADPAQTIFVSDNTDGIDGFIRMSCGNPAPEDGDSDTEISTFYVQPRQHGKGIGCSLLKAAIGHCKDLEISSVWLATNSENTPAIDYYLSRGFEKRGTTHFRVGEQAYRNDVFVLALR